MAATTTDLDSLSVNTIRGLCMDAVQKARSGHSGTPMDIAPVAYTLWQQFLRFDPADPIWPNRDRFVPDVVYEWLADGVGVRGRRARTSWETVLRPAWHSPAPVTSRPATGPEATSTTASASTWPRPSPTAWPWRSCARRPCEYRNQMLPPAVRARGAIEQASTLGGDRYIGDHGAVVGMHTFGASAPIKQLLKKFGFTPDRVTHVARELVVAGGETR